MIKNVVYLLISCLLGAVPAHAFTPDSSYLYYYRAVAAAEAAVTGGRYAAAVAQYQAVFGQYGYQNPVDCYVAAQVAAYSEDTAAVLDFLRKGLCVGLPLSSVRSNPQLSRICQVLAPSVIDSCSAVYRNSINRKARMQMLALIRRDQQVVHGLKRGQRLYARDGYTLKAEYQPLWDSLLQQLLGLVHRDGFPAQRVIGTQQEDDSLFRAGPLSVFALPLLVHHGRAWEPLADLLWQELKRGNLTPQMYGMIYEASSGKGPYETPVLYFAARPCQEKACHRLVRAQLAAINRAREEIGLCSYEVMQEKFRSVQQYRHWRSQGGEGKQPYFDFQCELAFQGLY